MTVDLVGKGRRLRTVAVIPHWVTRSASRTPWTTSTAISAGGYRMPFTAPLNENGNRNRIRCASQRCGAWAMIKMRYEVHYGE